MNSQGMPIVNIHRLVRKALAGVGLPIITMAVNERVRLIVSAVKSARYTRPQVACVLVGGGQMTAVLKNGEVLRIGLGAN